MPHLSPYLLTFSHRLHLGTSVVNLEDTSVSIPSDTLFAAILDVWNRTGGVVADFVAPFLGAIPAPPFLLSSAFPFAGQLRFYPLPIHLGSIFQKNTLRTYGKKLKCLQYFSEGLLYKALNGEMLDSWLFPKDEEVEPGSGIALQGGAFWLLDEEVQLLPAQFQRLAGKRRALQHLAIWKRELTSHITLDRQMSTPNLYHSGSIVFAPGCGLWFAISWQQEQATLGQGILAQSGLSYVAALEQVLGWLQEDGLGGERSTGAGTFRLQAATAFSLPDPQPGKAAYLLSRYHPRPDELPSSLSHPHVAYQLEIVGGWFRSFQGAAQRRKLLYLVKEGSLVAPPVFPAGDLVDVRPTFSNSSGDFPHPVYRSGYALAAGWPLPPKEATDA